MTEIESMLSKMSQEEFDGLLVSALKNPAVLGRVEAILGTGRFTRARIIQAIRSQEMIITPSLCGKRDGCFACDDLLTCTYFSTGSINVGISNELRIPLSEKEIVKRLRKEGVKIRKKARIAYVLTERFNYLYTTKPAIIVPGCAYILRPGETVLGITKCRFTLKKNLCAEIHVRSKFARGFIVLQLTPVIEPGVDNYQVLEITNVSSICLVLVPEELICKMTFQKGAAGETMFEEKYAGLFKQQSLILPGEIAEHVGHPLSEIPGLPYPVIILDRKFIENLEINWPVGPLAHPHIRKVIRVINGVQHT